jgi:FkbM family methyltransferase
MGFLTRSTKVLVGKLRRRAIPSTAYDSLPFNTILPLLIRGIYQQAYSEGKALGIIQIGANDGVKDDPLQGIIGQPGTRALLVEPQPACVRKLRDKYKDNPNVIIAEKAVGAESGKITLFRFEDILDDSRQISVFCSADKRHLERWKSRLRIVSDIIPFEVEVLPLTELVRAFDFTDIDILMTDVEGFDYEILHPYLRGCNVVPRWLIYEKCNLSPEQQASLASLAKTAGGDVFDFGMDALVTFKVR